MIEVECLLCSQEYFKMQEKFRKKKQKRQKAFAKIERLLLYKPPFYKEKIIGICEQYRGRY